MPRVSKGWPSDLTKRLIREYEKMPEMWKLDHPYYNNRLKHQENFCKLAKLLKKTELEVKNKIRGLRTTFYKEYSTQRLRRTYTTKWEYYADLKFVQSIYANKLKSSTNSQTSSACSNVSNTSNILKNEDRDESYSNQSTELKYKSIFAKEDNELALNHVIVDDEFTQSLYRTIKVSPSEEDCRLELDKETNESCIPFIDECQHFGNFIASEMRDMPLWKRRILKNDVLQSLLNNY